MDIDLIISAYSASTVWMPQSAEYLLSEKRKGIRVDIKSFYAKFSIFSQLEIDHLGTHFIVRYIFP